MSWVIWLQQKLFPTDVESPGSALPAGGRPRSSRWQNVLPSAPSQSHKPARSLAATVGHLDRPELVRAELVPPERELFDRLTQCMAEERLELHRLASTSSSALDMASRESIEMRQIVDTIQRDPMLSSELLRVANSATYATDSPAANLQQAVMRIGLRAVRGVVFTAAMKSASSASDALAPFADEVWRAACSAGRLARSIAVPLGFDPETAYVIGLLHDLGKVALLGHLDRTPFERPPTSAFIAKVFETFHERAGSAMARAWKLSPELVSVASQHHSLQDNTDFPRSAALAKLAFEIDRSMALADEDALKALAVGAEFELLGVDEDTRWDVLEHARHAWLAAEEAAVRR